MRWISQQGSNKRARTGLGLALCVLFALISHAQDATPSPLAKHQGTWKVVSFTRNDSQTPKEITDSIIRIVEKDHVIWKRNGKAFAGTKIVLDDSKSPTWIDVLPDGGPGKGEKIPGIYRQEGENLTICMADKGKTRPTEFASPKGSDLTLMVFRRAPPMVKMGETTPPALPDKDKK